MADKTITLPEEIIDTLLKIKRNNETITDVLRRIIRSVEKKERMLEWLEKKEANEDLATAVESVYENREEWTIRNFG